MKHHILSLFLSCCIAVIETLPVTGSTSQTCFLKITVTRLLLYSAFLSSQWERCISISNMKSQHSSRNSLRIWLKQTAFCFFCVYVCVYRANKLAASEWNVQAIHSPNLKTQNIKRDKKQSMDMPIDYERPLSSNLNEIANIKFNTGVSIFARIINLMCLIAV